MTGPALFLNQQDLIRIVCALRTVRKTVESFAQTNDLAARFQMQREIGHTLEAEITCLSALIEKIDTILQAIPVETAIPENPELN